MGRVDGKVALITGAARGMGRAHAVRLAREGADIIALDLCRQVDSVRYPLASPHDLAETVRLVEALDRRIVAAEVDVRDLAALQEVTSRAVAELGRLDIVLANAGISTLGRLLDLDEQTWNDMIDVNLTGVWKTLKASVPHIVEGGRGGAVVIISSVAALSGAANTGHYTAAKSGLVGMMRVLASELGPKGIRVNTVHPTTVATPMILNDMTFRLFRPDLPNPGRQDFEAAAKTLNAMRIPMLDPEDIAAAVLHLVSDEARFVTGTTHVVDAGNAL